MGTIGSDAVGYLANGMTSRDWDLASSATLLANTIINTFSTILTSGDISQWPLYYVGANATYGLSEGIRSRVETVKDAVIQTTTAAVEAAKKSLEVKSPSRVFYRIGEYVPQGMINGILSLVDQVSDAGDVMGNAAINSVKDAISKLSDLVENGIDSEPTIRPVMDLSEIQNGIGVLDGMFSNGIDLSRSISNVRSTGMTLSGLSDETPINAKNISNNYNFTQNNYSPKALSRGEIYRQTKNQFAAMKGAVSGR